MSEESIEIVADKGEDVHMLVGMGFTAEQSRRALEACGGNVDGLVDTLLLSGRQDSVGRSMIISPHDKPLTCHLPQPTLSL